MMTQPQISSEKKGRESDVAAPQPSQVGTGSVYCLVLQERENMHMSYMHGCHLTACSGTALSAPESGPCKGVGKGPGSGGFPLPEEREEKRDPSRFPAS